MENTSLSRSHNSLAMNSFALVDGLQETFEHHTEITENQENKLIALLNAVQQKHQESEARHAQEKTLLEGRISLISKQLEANARKIEQVEKMNLVYRSENHAMREKIQNLLVRWEDHDKSWTEMSAERDGKKNERYEALMANFVQLHALVEKGLEQTQIAESSSHESTEEVSRFKNKIASLERQLDELKIAVGLTRGLSYKTAKSAGIPEETLKAYDESEELSITSLNQAYRTVSRFFAIIQKREEENRKLEEELTLRGPISIYGQQWCDRIKELEEKNRMLQTQIITLTCKRGLVK